MGNEVFPGGKPLIGEDAEPTEHPVETAIRELGEETGLMAQESSLSVIGLIRIFKQSSDIERSLRSSTTVAVFAAPIDAAAKSFAASPADSDLQELSWRHIEELDLTKMPLDYGGWLPVGLSTIEAIAKDELPGKDVRFVTNILRGSEVTAQVTDVTIDGKTFRTEPVAYSDR